MIEKMIKYEIKNAISKAGGPAPGNHHWSEWYLDNHQFFTADLKTAFKFCEKLQAMHDSRVPEEVKSSKNYDNAPLYKMCLYIYDEDEQDFKRARQF